MCKCEGDLSHSGRLLLLRFLWNGAFFLSPAAPNDKDKSGWISHCESSGQIAHKVERLAQSPKGLWFGTRQKQCVLKPATLMITFKSIRRGSVAQWDNLQIYTCGLLMLCELFQLLSAQILFEIWCVIRVSRPKDESSTTRVSQSPGQIAQSVGGLVGAVVGSIAAGWMSLSLTIIKLIWSNGKK